MKLLHHSGLVVVAICILYVALVFGEPQPANPLLSYEVLYNWKELDFDFESDSDRQSSIASKSFIKENNVIVGVKVSDNRVFLTVPRWRPGVPATLVSLPYSPNASAPAFQEVTNSPSLVPFPSWKMNKLGNCSALQSVVSMEIDQFDRMWVLDAGRVNIFESPDNTCPPKLVILDLATNTTLRTHIFPEDVVSRKNSFLNDIVVACLTKETCWAYITDARESQIVVYNYGQDQSWFVKHSTMKADPKALSIRIDGQNYTFNSSVNGIALSPLDTGFKTLYYSPLSSFSLFSVPTEALQKAGDSNGPGANLDDSIVTTLGSKASQSGGMIVDSSGLLYFGLYGLNSVNSWNTSYANLTNKNQALLIQSDIDLQTPDTFAIDRNGFAFVTTNRLQRFLTKSYDFETTNFRVVRFFVGLKNYMYSKNDAVEPTAEPEAEAEPKSEPEPETSAEPTAEAEPKSEPEATAEPKSEPEADSEPKATSQPEPESEPTSEPEVASEPKAESEPTAGGSDNHNDKHRYDIHNDHEHHDNQDHADNVIHNEGPRALGANSSGRVSSFLTNTIVPVLLSMAYLRVF